MTRPCYGSGVSSEVGLTDFFIHFSMSSGQRQDAQVSSGHNEHQILLYTQQAYGPAHQFGINHLAIVLHVSSWSTPSKRAMTPLEGRCIRGTCRYDGVLRTNAVQARLVQNHVHAQPQRAAPSFSDFQPQHPGFHSLSRCCAGSH